MFIDSGDACQEKYALKLTIVTKIVKKKTRPHGGERARLGYHPVLPDNIIQYIEHTIGGRNHLRVRLIGTLGDDHIRQLLRKLHVGSL